MIVLFAGSLRMNTMAARYLLTELARRLPTVPVSLEEGSVLVAEARPVFSALRPQSIFRSEHERLVELCTDLAVRGVRDLSWRVDEWGGGTRAIRESEKREILDRIFAAWLQLPEMNLGALLTGACSDMFLVPDSSLAERVDAFVKQRLRCPHDTPKCAPGSRCERCRTWPGHR